MKLSDQLKAERAHVEKQLGAEVICNRCGATLKTIFDKCGADLSDDCPGFNRIEKSKREFWDGQYGVRP